MPITGPLDLGAFSHLGNRPETSHMNPRQNLSQELGNWAQCEEALKVDCTCNSLASLEVFLTPDPQSFNFEVQKKYAEKNAEKSVTFLCDALNVLLQFNHL